MVLLEVLAEGILTQLLCTKSSYLSLLGTEGE